MTDKTRAEQYAESQYPGNSSQDKYKAAVAGFTAGAEWQAQETERLREALRQIMDDRPLNREPTMNYQYNRCWHMANKALTDPDGV